MPPKIRKTTGLWVQCDKCLASLLQKDVERHWDDCPPNITSTTYGFVTNCVLYGTLDVKSNEDIKSVSRHDRDNMVFLSQSAVQLCSLSIGEWTQVRCLSSTYSSPVARTVWPTTEKNVTSVLFTKNGIDLSFQKADCAVSVSKIAKPPKDARLVSLVVSNAPRSMELSQELQLRLHKSHQGRLLTTSNNISILFYGKLLKFLIKSIDSADTYKDDDVNLADAFSALSVEDAQFYRVTEKTSWKLYRDEAEYEKKATSMDLFEKIGGLDEEVAEINGLLRAALQGASKILRFKACKAVLLYGNSGTGKTLLANALAKSSKANVVNVCATALYAKSGSVEETLKALFVDAVEHSPSVVLIDEVDVLCPTRGARTTDVEKRTASSVLKFFDVLCETDDCKVFVLGTTNKLDSVDPAFRRCGRFDWEIEIATPNPAARFDILKKLLADAPNDLEVGDLKEIADTAHGFVGVDLVSLCSRAAWHATKLNKAALDCDDFKHALTRVRPSAMREVQVEVPNVKWADIGGQHRLKLILRQSVEWPLKHADCFVRMGITPPRGVLMYGPPGCSKTMIAKALATESGLNFLSIKGPELFSKWVGESERAVREVFRKARQVAPSVIFFDEIDALGGERASGSSTSVQERVLAQLLTELDGVSPLGDVTVLAATNRPDRIDRALLRPGRLDRMVYVALPDEPTRKEIFQLKTARMPVVDVNVDELVSATEGYSGAEVNAVCHEAAMAALEENLDANAVETRHFKKAVALVRPRTDPSLVQIYEAYFNK